VAAGEYHSMVLQQDGGVWATGRNNFGQLGDGSEIDRICFTVVASTIDGLWHAVLLVLCETTENQSYLVVFENLHSCRNCFQHRHKQLLHAANT